MIYKGVHYLCFSRRVAREGLDQNTKQIYLSRQPAALWKNRRQHWFYFPCSNTTFPSCCPTLAQHCLITKIDGSIANLKALADKYFLPLCFNILILAHALWDQKSCLFAQSLHPSGSLSTNTVNTLCNTKLPTSWSYSEETTKKPVKQKSYLVLGIEIKIGKTWFLFSNSKWFVLSRPMWR